MNQAPRPMNQVEPMEPEEKQRLAQRLEKKGGLAHQAHLFLCGGPRCATPEEGEAAWQKLKAVAARRAEAGQHFYRTRAACLRICQGGPVALAYPQGCWYGRVTEEQVESVVNHMLDGEEPHPLEFARHPLPPPKPRRG